MDASSGTRAALSALSLSSLALVVAVETGRKRERERINSGWLLLRP